VYTVAVVFFQRGRHVAVVDEQGAVRLGHVSAVNGQKLRWFHAAALVEFQKRPSGFLQ
jgi:hypothetical protein